MSRTLLTHWAVAHATIGRPGGTSGWSHLKLGVGAASRGIACIFCNPPAVPRPAGSRLSGFDHQFAKPSRQVVPRAHNGRCGDANDVQALGQLSSGGPKRLPNSSADVVSAYGIADAL